MAWHRADECSRRLAQIPGVGPIGASLLMMKTPGPELFKSGRHFSAWIGLTPKDHSTAGRNRLGIITRADDEVLRSTLVLGATSLLRRVREGRGRNTSPWLLELLKRKVAETGRSGTGQQNRPHRLENDGDRRSLSKKYCVGGVGLCSIRNQSVTVSCS